MLQKPHDFPGCVRTFQASVENRCSFSDLSFIFWCPEDFLPGLTAFLNEVVNQTYTVSFLNGQRFMFTVRKKRYITKIREVRAAGVYGNFASIVTNPQFAAAIC